MRYWCVLVFLLITTGCTPVARSAGEDEIRAERRDLPIPAEPSLISTSSPAETGSAQIEPSSFPVLGAAPEFTNAVWLNSEIPLRLADLRGQVVLVDMWTFG
jgi:hypothetical protein